MFLPGSKLTKLLTDRGQVPLGEVSVATRLPITLIQDGFPCLEITSTAHHPETNTHCRVDLIIIKDISICSKTPTVYAVEPVSFLLQGSSDAYSDTFVSGEYVCVYSCMLRLTGLS